MAISPPTSILFFTWIFILLCTINADTVETHIQVYFHDIANGSKPTAIRVAQPASTYTSLTAFGVVVMFDGPLTETPDLSSKLMARAQGMYAFASQEEFGLLMAMNIVFLEGKFNGSTLAVLGKNAVYLKEREMPVVGGSGKFRFARGYVLAKTNKFDLNTGNAIVEWNIHVMHG